MSAAMRTVLAAALALCALLPVQAGMVVNPFLFSVPTPMLGLLSQAPVVAVSTRKIQPGYTGHLFVLRRSSDDTTTSIDAVGNEPDTASMLSFVGANNGFIERWYNQMGGGVDYVQLTLTRQAQVISSGALITFPNGKLGVRFDGSDDCMTQGDVMGQNFSRNGVYKFLSVASGQNIDSDNVQNSTYFSASGTLSSYNGASANIQTGISVNDIATVLERFRASGTQTAYYNGSGGSYTPSTLGSLHNALGASSTCGAGTFANVMVGEHILFGSTALSDADKDAMQANQKAYWGTP